MAILEGGEQPLKKVGVGVGAHHNILPCPKAPGRGVVFDAEAGAVAHARARDTNRRMEEVESLAAIEQVAVTPEHEPSSGGIYDLVRVGVSHEFRLGPTSHRDPTRGRRVWCDLRVGAERGSGAGHRFDCRRPGRGLMAAESMGLSSYTSPQIPRTERIARNGHRHIGGLHRPNRVFLRHQGCVFTTTGNWIGVAQCYGFCNLLEDVE